MVRGAAILILLSLVTGFPCAWGFDDGARERYFSGRRSPDDQALIHGYYPREFSETFPDYWVTSEKAGHYIMGHAEPSDYRPTYTAPAAVSPGDPTRVLVSAPETTILIETADVPPTVRNRPTRTNDSLDLQKVIDEHRWLIPKHILDQI